MTRIAIVGGTGPEGRGLALRLAMAGHEVVIGSRDAGRAADAASGLLEAHPHPDPHPSPLPEGEGIEQGTLSTAGEGKEQGGGNRGRDSRLRGNDEGGSGNDESGRGNDESGRGNDEGGSGDDEGGLAISGAANADAVNDADVVLLAVPFEGLRPTAESLREALAGRLVVSIVAPVEFTDGQMRALNVPEGSAGELARDLLPESRVAAAFQNMSARDLLRADHPLEGDVAVTADDESARRETMALAEAMPSLRAVDAGPLSNSRYVEELTALLVNLNRIHKAHSTIRFLGL